MSLPVITVTRGAAHTYRVTVEEGDETTVHDVTVSPEDVQRYAPGSTAERLVQASFEFLLARESKESILRRFELPLIERYFPEFGRIIGDRC